MKIRPSKGFAFIEEDTQDPLREGSSLKDSGFELTDNHNVGVYGDVIAVNNSSGGFIYELWSKMFGRDLRTIFRIGQKVIFSKFVAERIYLEDDDGKEMTNIRCVPTEMILGIIT